MVAQLRACPGGSQQITHSSEVSCIPTLLSDQVRLASGTAMPLGRLIACFNIVAKLYVTSFIVIKRQKAIGTGGSRLKEESSAAVMEVMRAMKVDTPAALPTTLADVDALWCEEARSCVSEIVSLLDFL